MEDKKKTGRSNIRTAVNGWSDSGSRIRKRAGSRILKREALHGAKDICDIGKSLKMTRSDSDDETDFGAESGKNASKIGMETGSAVKKIFVDRKALRRKEALVRQREEKVRRRLESVKKKIDSLKDVFKKGAGLLSKPVSFKGKGIIGLCALFMSLILLLINALMYFTTSSVSSFSAWLFPDKTVSDDEALITVSYYFERIEKVRLEKQGEISEIADSLSPEYRYNGERIEGLNNFEYSEITPFDRRAVLALVAAKKYGEGNSDPALNTKFTDDEIEEALEMFYDLEYFYMSDTCPLCDCKIDSGEVLSLSGDDFYIDEIFFDAQIRSFFVTFKGDTYSNTESVYTSLQMYVSEGGAITGEGAARITNGEWYMTYEIDGDFYDRIDWDNVFLTLDTLYCPYGDHTYLYGSVRNLSEEEVLWKANLSDKEESLYILYREQIKYLEGENDA